MKPTPHTPKAHQRHAESTIPCGCWTVKGQAAVCSVCGASYNLADVLEFPRWRCYDCQTNLSPYSSQEPQ